MSLKHLLLIENHQYNLMSNKLFPFKTINEISCKMLIRLPYSNLVKEELNEQLLDKLLHQTNDGNDLV